MDFGTIAITAGTLVGFSAVITETVRSIFRTRRELNA